MWNAKGVEKRSSMWKRTENSIMTVRGYPRVALSKLGRLSPKGHYLSSCVLTLSFLSLL